MPRGLNRSGDFRNGNPVTLPKNFGNVVDWTPSPAEFGNPVDSQPSPANFGNPVTWVPSPNHFGNPIGGSVGTPTFSPAAGSYSIPQVVQITATGSDSIFYTLDGTAPSKTSMLYQGSIFVPSSLTIKAIAYADDGTPSSVGTAAYIISLT